MTRAAAKLHIAQPALSQAIAQLEARLGVQLLERHARGVRLTPAGERFLTKARAAVEAAAEADLTAQAFARAASGKIEVGYIGPPPEFKVPEAFVQFAAQHPEVEISGHDLPFPRGSTSSWLEDVDLALCHPPQTDPEMHFRPLRAEPRTVVAAKHHPLAERTELLVEEVLEETFISYHPDVQPGWAGFHSLDDHRGAPPANLTRDHVASPPEMLSAMASRRAITTVPASDAEIIMRVLRGLVAIPLADAEPFTLAIVWRGGDRNPLVASLLSTVAAAECADSDGHRLVASSFRRRPPEGVR